MKQQTDLPQQADFSQQEDLLQQMVFPQQAFPLDSFIRAEFDIADVDIRTYSPLVLAYIGDGVFDLVVRSVVVGKGNTNVNQMHRRTSQVVKAHTQAMMAEALKDCLTEEEQNIYRRGRNANSPTMAKNATMADYRRATGFEALIGYLYLTDNFLRILELTKLAAEKLDLQF